MGVYEIKKPKRINVFSVSLFLIAIAFVGGLSWFLPIWWPVFQLTGIMQGVCNDMYRERSNEVLMKKLLKDSARTGLQLVPENFILERIPYTQQELNALNMGDTSAVAIRGKECRLTLRYLTDTEIPVIKKRIQIPWSRTIQTDLKVIKY